ncbi:alpha/beta hydrolase [Longimycelium tulufanense]|uniref:Alpha/beta hydrolase n=1 Tax=Longimycelium tulufanense TaxID=907463 RepID=A0A8J3C9V1_9PSEU|nr:alpha/beta hydrolase [Longimycelium tulufanense]GGM62048.1 alpha/beta hydrolase [Longimycelium tulufanense]
MDTELESWKATGEWFDYLGFEVFYLKKGNGPYLLLVHGYPFSSFDWKLIWPALARRFTVIAPDMLGMGFSDKPVRYEYSVHDHTDMHEALLTHLGVGQCHILAHDLGDSVVQEMLARHEEGSALTISSITWLNGGLFNEAYTPRPMQVLLSKTPLGGLFAMRPQLFMADPLVDRTINELFGPDTKPSPELLRQFHDILGHKDGKRVMHKVGRFIVDRYRYRNRWVRAMRQTSVPMRLIDGPYDPNSGRHMADRYRQVVPDANVVLLDAKIGHWPQIEDPGNVITHFLEFIDRAEDS